MISSSSAWDPSAEPSLVPSGQRGSAIPQTLLIIDDCVVYRNALASMFTGVGTADVHLASDLSSLVSVLQEVDPEVILLNMATRNLELILRAATSLRPRTPVVAVGTSDDDEHGIVSCAESGVAGYHMRSDTFADLVTLIGEVTRRGVSSPPTVSTKTFLRISELSAQRQASQGPVLTVREAQVLDLLTRGLSNHDIAARLEIAVHTVKNHVHSLLTKLGVNTRAEAAALSRTHRLLEDP